MVNKTKDISSAEQSPFYEVIALMGKIKDEGLLQQWYKDEGNAVEAETTPKLQ